MTRTYRYPLRPNRQQEAVLLAWLEYCRQLYNAALEHRINAWRRARVSINYNAQSTELTELRAADAEAASIPVEVQRSALRRLDRAFQAFFRRCKSSEKPGFPRFRGREWFDSFSFGARPRVQGDRVFVPKLGPIRFHAYRELQGEVREVTIRRRNGRWFVCFSCDLGEAPPKVAVASAVGIDLGLTSFAVLSDGSEIENPRFFRQGEELLARRQRSLARKRRGSNSRRRARLLVGKAHDHVRNQRLDFARKLAADLCARYDLIAHEDLSIHGMIQRPVGPREGGDPRSSRACASATLVCPGRPPAAKSISDAAWGLFIHALTCKAESAGKHVVAVDPRGTSQRCSGCGATVKKDLWERRHDCSCGLSLGRDHNAALNVLALGRSAA